MAQDLTFVQPTDKELAVQQTEDGPIAVIGEQELPLIDSILDVKVIQPGSVKNDKSLKDHIGKFYYPDLQESFDELIVMPINVLGQGRRLFPPFGEGDGELICMSNDGEFPSDKVDSPISECCGTFVQKGDRQVFEPLCEKAKWSEDGEKPECQDVLSVAFYDLNMSAPIRMQFHGTGMSAWNAFVREFKKYRNIARLKRKSIMDYVIKITLENEGTYHKMQFKFEEAKDLDPKAYLPLLAWYKKNLTDRSFEDEEPAGSDGAEAPVGDVDGVSVDGADDGDEGEAISV